MNQRDKEELIEKWLERQITEEELFGPSEGAVAQNSDSKA